jgi:hypothetical protein
MDRHHGDGNRALPGDSCSEPANELDCFGLWERGLSIARLTFDAEPIPEPGSVLLLGLALLAASRRQRRR